MTSASKPQKNLRNIVLEMLLQTERGKKSHLVLKETLDNESLPDRQHRAFVTRLYQGTLERMIELDYIINQFSKTPVNKMKPVIRNIMRMSVYQMKYMDSVPVSAICNEAVKLTVKRKFGTLRGFVNGVLRNISRNLDSIEIQGTDVEKMSVIYSMPKWIVELWLEQYGPEQTQKMLEKIYCEQPTTVRCNSSKAKTEDIIENLKYQGVKVERSKLYKDALYLSDYDNLNSLVTFHSGMITVQNLSSMMAGLAANPKEGDYIIDVCAAPGGKSLHMAELLHGTGMVEARDLTVVKTKLIRENVERTGYKNIVIKEFDATKPDEDSVEKADIIMADLPCSGLGVMGNKSDIKYNVSPDGIKELVALQRKILGVVYKYVKPGGKLIFSTCTVNKMENDENVRWIEENLPLKLQSLEGILPKELGGEKGYVQIYPGQYNMDGFFISSFVKE